MNGPGGRGALENELVLLGVPDAETGQGRLEDTVGRSGIVDWCCEGSCMAFMNASGAR